MATREAVSEALFAKLQSTGAFPTATRRNASPETIALPGQPALVLAKHHERYEKKGIAVPPVRTITFVAILYIDVGAVAAAIPDAILNPLQDAIDAALVADNGQTGACTLGGLVQSAMIVGEPLMSPGDKTGRGTAIIPIEVILP